MTSKVSSGPGPPGAPSSGLGRMGPGPSQQLARQASMGKKALNALALECFDYKSVPAGQDEAKNKLDTLPVCVVRRLILHLVFDATVTKDRRGYGNYSIRIN